MNVKVSEILNVFRTYSLHSLPKYIADWLGFHYPTFQSVFATKLQTYVLRNKTRFIVRPFSYDRVVIDEIFIHRAYTPKHFDIKNEDIVVDLGAHIGAFTVFAAKKTQSPKAYGIPHVYSYEPEPINFAILKNNVKLNDLEKETKIFRSAVAGKAGVLSLYTNESGVASAVNTSAQSISVEAVTLEDIFIKNKLSEVDFLKVDVEGAEWDVFKAAAGCDCLTRIKKIAMECHSARDTLRLKALLEASGFRVQIAPGGHSTLFYIYAIGSEE